MTTKTVLEKERVVVRFAGDSGDGMQLTGDRFTNATAIMGNDLATLPDFPAEIRAPAGTLAGVSAFQIHFASRDIVTRAAEGIDITKKEAERAKNMFALGLLSWMYSRPTDLTLRWIEEKFASKPE